MTSKVVGVTAVAFSRDQERIEYLRESFDGDVVINEKQVRFTPEELIPFLQHCDYAIIGLDKITDDVLSQCPQLKVISKYGVGLDNIDFKACAKHGVKVVYPKGVNKRSVSEEVLGASLSLLRNLYVTSNLLKKGEWLVQGGRQLTNTTFGIIGVGHIGKDLIEVLKPFNCELLVNDIIEQDAYYASVGAKAVSKEEIFQKCDVISIHTPLDEQTKHMVNTETLAMMKSNAIIINAARGGIVDENALKRALLDNKIAGAALDVYEVEPAEDKALLEIPNLMCMPHIGGNAKEAVVAMGMAAITNLINAIE
ncbi:hydroxyacid dehydrogenase [Hydrogenovibrio sp. SC-1]|uniref:phosphoglycerate dehydrogenase n=1 Tax=Hydrogenovibrio sp. SC-1 TaxID=2065820 RepID=UPI000C7C1F01|nr:phosphoglycerate dehydrogenase [Hydrogenovibrio sp. SC-1]PLA75532.1 hydroxyacid dehydrogenase [Hydrogenovibrio sp. SC-1]